MALDRQSIERRDFPIGRRGYEPDAVDEHLAMLADEVDALRRSASRSSRTDSLASAASEQVRLIVEAAEQSAADIEREAELEARQIRQEARESAESQRSEAGQQAREHVERVSRATSSMLERADSLEAEFQAMLEHVRTGASRLGQELQALQGLVSDLRAATAPARAPTPAPAAEPAAPTYGSTSSSGYAAPAPYEPAPVQAQPATDYGVHGDPTYPEFDNTGGETAAPEGPGDEYSEEPQLQPDPAAPAEPASTGGGAYGGGGDEEGARLIALNMALNGTPREETERYLTDNFSLADTEALLDDVYARAGQ